MSGCLIVDGYNVIFSWETFEGVRKTGLEHARDKLVDIMVNFAALTGWKVIIVFDAACRMKGNSDREKVFNCVEVIYAPKGKTADSVIEKLAGDINEGDVYVVTSDWDEQKIVFGRGAYRMTPGELMERVIDARRNNLSRYTGGAPTDGYLENRLLKGTREIMETWRRRES